MNLRNSSLSPKLKQESDDNMIPLINIIFLLLIFYMIAGQIQATQVQGLELPEMSDKTVAQRAPMVLQITHNNKLYLNGENYPIDELAQVIQSQNKEQKNTVNIYADHRLHAKQLNEILDVLRAQDIEKIELISEQSL